MSDRFSQPKQRPGSSKRNSLLSPTLPSRLQPSLEKGIGVVVVLAFVSGAALLASDVLWLPFPPFAHAPISAVPLVLIGLAALGFQLVIRPSRLDLLKACIVSLAFLLWGMDQLLPTGWLATTVGDVVIILYVVDLGWMMLDRLTQQSQSDQVSQEMTAPSPAVPTSIDGPTQPLHMLPVPLLSSHDPHPLRQRKRSSPCPPVSEQTTRAASTLKRHRLLPLPTLSQERQPST